MEINCTFRTSPGNRRDIYTCFIDKANITEKDQVIKKFKGNHEEGKSHEDIKHVRFRNTKVNYFPRGLEKHFPNLTQLIIIGCDIKEISRNDLKGLEGLVDFRIIESELTSLPDDLFTEMPNLRRVSFDGDEIEFASSNLLKPLIGRENVLVCFRGNKNIDAFFWPGEEGSLKALEDLMKLIDEMCLKPVPTIIPTIIPDPFDGNQLIKEMWVSGMFSDLTIIAGEKKFKVHKTILSLRSKVFAQMFEDQSEATEINIPDFSSGSVEALLTFIYTNEISKDGNAKENLEIADKFRVKAMKTVFEKIIFNQLDDSNSEEIFLLAHRFSSQILMEKAFRLTAARIAEKYPNLPFKFLEDPEKLKKLIDARRLCREILEDK